MWEREVSLARTVATRPQEQADKNKAHSPQSGRGGPKDKKFMMKNFKQLLLSIHDKTMSEQKTILENTFQEWKGDTEQVDDILVIGVRF